MERKQQRRAAMAERRIEQPQPAYACSRCGEVLFDAAKKFDSRTGFPSFWQHVGDRVTQKQLTTYNRERIQLLCSGCGQHLGHLFPNKHTPTRVRYCINAASIAPSEAEVPEVEKGS